MSHESIRTEPWGETDSVPVRRFTLNNGRGLRMQVLDYGGIVTSLETPDRAGASADIVLGYDTLEAYLDRTPYFGALIGRVGNRIADARFALDGVVHTLAANNQPGGIPCALHGGLRGFDKVVWSAEPEASDGEPGLHLRYSSPAGEEGYPGTLEVEVRYRLTRDNGFHIAYRATTDAPTPVNLTQHSYFNLAGHASGPITGHTLTLHAGAFTPVNRGLIPTGEIRSVEGTPFDFRRPTAMGARIDAPDEQLIFGAGYDHNWVLEGPPGELQHAATVDEPVSGRRMEVWTREPGVQFYSGNYLGETMVGKGGIPYARRAGFCLETQHYPDSPNHPEFPSIILRPGEVYATETVYRFPAG